MPAPLIVSIASDIDVGSPMVNHRLFMSVDNLQWDVYGLCKDASVLGVGTEADARDALSWIGLPILIKDNAERPLWWGYIDTVESTVGALTRKRSINTLVNRYQAVYTEPTISGRGATYTSAWTQDDISVARHGIHEQRLSLQGVTSAQAAQAVTTALAVTKDPTNELSIGTATAGKQPTVKLMCKGWLETLRWQYYSQSSGYIAHNVNGDKYHKLGLGLTDTIIGFYRGRKTIHDLDGRLGVFKKDDQIRVSGSTSNNGVFTVTSSTSRDVFSVTSTGIAFRTFTGKSRIKDAAYGLGDFKVGASVVVTGSASNNGTYTIKGMAGDGGYLEFDDVLTTETSGASITLTSGSIIYTASTISVTGGSEWQVTDLLGKTLGDLDAGDMVKITGSAANDGVYFVVASASDGTYAELDRAVTTAAAGASITIERGSQIAVEEAITTEYSGASVTVQTYGSAVGQQITLASGSWTIDTIRVRVRKVGSPVDRLMGRICVASSGLPAAALEAAYVDGADLTTSADWIPFDYGNTITIASGTPRCFIIQREFDALSTTDYYEVALDSTAAYSGGAVSLYTGSAWALRSPAADLPFIALGAWETTYQAEQIVSSAGQFLAGTDIKTASGVYANQYQDGKRTAYDVLSDMLKLGYSDGRRMQVTITPERILRLTVEPEPPGLGVRAYGILDSGRMVDMAGENIPYGEYPVGVWADTRNSLFDDDPIFIERVAWKPGSMPRIEVRNQKPALSSRGIIQG